MQQNKPINLLPENMINLLAANTDTIQLPFTEQHNVAADVLRLDKIHPVISGNKWFKLKYYLLDALKNGQKTIITFGGAYSNHIIATACAASNTGLKSIGIIRGEKTENLSHTLIQAEQMGMQLIFVSRSAYNQKKDPAFIQQLQSEYSNASIIPEGGEGETGKKGAAEILALTDTPSYTHIICAVGTGTLLAGLASGANKHQQVIGIPVLKGFNGWTSSLLTAEEQQRTILINDYHFGGYAKKNNELIDFMNKWFLQTKIPSDFVYTGKLFYAVEDLIKKGFFPAKSRLLIIHSGGLQGNYSLPAKTLHF